MGPEMCQNMTEPQAVRGAWGSVGASRGDLAYSAYVLNVHRASRLGVVGFAPRGAGDAQDGEGSERGEGFPEVNKDLAVSHWLARWLVPRFWQLTEC